MSRCHTRRRYTFWADEDLSTRLKIAAAAAHTTPSKLLRHFIAWGFDRLVAEGVIQRTTSNWKPAPEPDTHVKPEDQKTNENTQS
jgi:hypothetical protein